MQGFRQTRGVVKMGTISEPFYEWNVKNAKNIPEEAGVYGLYEAMNDERLIYIGSSSNLRERFTQYWDTKFSEDQCKRSTRYYKREFTGSYESREKELLEQYKREHDGKLPKCNEVVP